MTSTRDEPSGRAAMSTAADFRAAVETHGRGGGSGAARAGHRLPQPRDLPPLRRAARPSRGCSDSSRRRSRTSATPTSSPCGDTHALVFRASVAGARDRGHRPAAPRRGRADRRLHGAAAAALGARPVRAGDGRKGHRGGAGDDPRLAGPSRPDGLRGRSAGCSAWARTSASAARTCRPRSTRCPPRACRCSRAPPRTTPTRSARCSTSRAS